ncbi:MAG: DUF5666 domain-containing protein [Patescibacteria group bacterium]|nr:DUF5666 domain-containing protein [Patescibacteria group bacterium]
MKNNIVIMVVIVVLVGIGAFFGGTKYQQSKQQTAFSRQGGPQGTRTGQGQQQGNRQGFRPVTGDIISSDSNSITVKLSDGSSKIVILSAQTAIIKASQATKDDLKTGEKVAVFGQTNTDGSITAQNIQLNPLQRNMQVNPGN